ncbi:unnamed protein product [Dicrocoelium dendriticum]|nr:unnamed protein product [Dicrocoelium dendriticum]
MQNDKPINFHSRTLTVAELRYAQIEKVMLALVYAVERFSYYALGRKSTAFTYHHPLVSIASEPLHFVPRRLQMKLIHLKKDDLDFVYWPGSQMHIADSPSRAHVADQPGTEEDPDFAYATLLIVVVEERLHQLQRYNEVGELGRLLKHMTMNVWPEDQKVIKRAASIPPFS